MGRFVAHVQAFALALGAPGLFLVALLDSSVLSLPEIADLLVIWMVTQHKHRFVLYAAAATLGSMAGCLVLYYIGKKGGDALIRRRFHPASVDKTMALFQRHGVLAVLIPSILPPPAPFKIFVLLAGVADISAARFTTAIAIGRGSRYFVEALLALRYGDQAIEFVNHNGKTVSYAILILLGIAIAAYMLWLRTQKRRPRSRAGDRVQ
jgi:membrane protein YqaA with SNARE-associated domain